MAALSPALALLLSLSGCKDKGSTTPPGDSGSDGGSDDPFAELTADETWVIPELACDASVIRTDANVPHVYARDREDLARVYAFVQARDRYFEMDLARRLGQGELSEILGADALETDMESRATGMTWVADNFLENLSEEQAAVFDAYAEGVNAYIAAVKAGDLPLASELDIAGPFLGVDDPTTLLTEWDRRDVAGVAAVLVYELGYETGDVGRSANLARLDGLFDGAALSDLRQDGLEQDLWRRVDPVNPSTSATGFGASRAVPASLSLRSPALGAAVSQDMLDRLADRLDRFEDRLGRGDLEAGWGSNVWAVGSSVSADGTALLAGDGHLPLSVPSLFWQVGLDTSVLGGGDTHQLGLGIPGLPILAVGTNGDVAWSQTQIMGDITDWYAEVVQLDSAGAPVSSLFQGTDQPLVAVEESHSIAEVPLLGSEGGTLTWTRYVTFDGRWIADIEGTAVAEDYTPADGETVVRFPGTAVVPGDTDGDGKVTAISFDYTAFSDGNMLNAVDGFGHSTSVEDFQEASKALVAYSQNMGVADRSGSVLYTGYQAVPCRGYLPREADGTWIDGADPSLLLDGTTYGGFEIPVGADGKVLEGETEDHRCVVPFDEYPQVVDPPQGYIVNANNDPGGLSLDGSLSNDPWYIGGPWVNGFRAARIEQLLDEGIAAGTADVDWMAQVQGDHRSNLGAWFSWHLVESIAHARALSETDGPWTEADGRLVALYESEREALDEVESRVSAWAEAGHPAASGVETFYHQPAAEDLDHSVATTLFNAWLSSWDDAVFGDEGLPGVWWPGSTDGKVRALTEMLEGRGPDNPMALASWNEETQESAFFDVLGTDEVETSHEVALSSMIEGLDFLRSEPGDATRGVGFGTEDMDAYKWGLRHQTRFESILSDFISGDEFSFLTDQFSVNTDALPLDGEAGTEDLDWFPRPGDNLAVDAANPGWGTDWTHSSGPVFRMVIELGPDGFVSGRNVIPGGQSALIDSPWFTDQAALWLANDTVPMHFYVEDVLAAAQAHERFSGQDCD